MRAIAIRTRCTTTAGCGAPVTSTTRRRPSRCGCRTRAGRRVAGRPSNGAGEAMPRSWPRTGVPSRVLGELDEIRRQPAPGRPMSGTGRLMAELSPRTRQLVYGELSPAEIAAELALMIRVDQAHLAMLAANGLISPA